MFLQFLFWIFIQRKEKHKLKNTLPWPIPTAALFLIVQTQKQPQRPLTHEWIKELGCIYIQWAGNHKKQGNLAICNSIGGPLEHYANCNESKTNT